MFRVTIFSLMLIFINPLLAEEISIQVKGLKIFGTLEVPVADKPVPLTILIAGSGPTDRDGNSIGVPGKNNSLKQIAEKLKENRIASFRYDKRMIGQSTGENKIMEADLSLDDYIRDAVDCIEFFRNDKRFSKITLIGHSEGSLIGMVAAQKSKVSGFISIAGMGRPADELILEQLKAASISPEMLKQCSEIIDSLKAERLVGKVNPQLWMLFRPSVQPFLISMFKYNPAVEIAKLDIPVLIIQGTTDIQVSENDAVLLEKAAKHPVLIIINGMNHVLKMVPVTDRAEQIKAYTDSSLQISEQLVKSIIEYINR